MDQPPGLDAYVLIQAARYLKVAPWMLAEQGVWWRDQAITAMSVDQKVQEALRDRK